MTDATTPAPRRGRGTELALLIFAVGIATMAYVAVDLGALGRIPPNTMAYLAGLSVITGIAHIVVRSWAPYADPVILPLVVTLNGLGLAMIHRLDLAEAEAAAQAGESGSTVDAPVQLTWMVVGVALFVLVLALVRDYRILSRFTYTAALLGIVLLLLPIVPGLGYAVRGAQIWIQIGPMTFQPGEAAKIVLIVAFAGYLVRTKDALALAGRRVLGVDLPRARDLGPILVVWVTALGILAFQRDLGPSLLLFGIFVLMIYVATERISWIVVGVALGLLGGLAVNAAFGHVRTRIEGWLDPFSDTDRFGQIVQSLYGLAYGGQIGTGLGRGRPDLVPFAESDFIAAAFGEELGLAGLMAIILIYALLASRGLRAALVLRDPFGKLLATGLAAGLLLQVFIVVGGVTKLIPLTGLTTPFLSLGGSSLVMNWVLVALLMRLSDAARRPAPPIQRMTVDDAVTQVVRLP
ncbi:MAG TPA: FtsW/RodA/SpoVE family cell cycle protein [Jiangellaceae bacterium]|nr:FtsW/RodA/SpoVE family cell cycle protein [Jiangellaceae bacterium]